MSTYTVEVSRDGKFWLLHIVELDKYTQARHLGEAEVMARDLIEIHSGESADSFGITVQIQVPAEVQAARESAANLREAARHATSAAAEAHRSAALLLRRQGITIRDIGVVLGVSHQRAQQLVSEAKGHEIDAA